MEFLDELKCSLKSLELQKSVDAFVDGFVDSEVRWKNFKKGWSLEEAVGRSCICWGGSSGRVRGLL